MLDQNDLQAIQMMMTNTITSAINTAITASEERTAAKTKAMLDEMRDEMRAETRTLIEKTHAETRKWIDEVRAETRTLIAESEQRIIEKTTAMINEAKQQITKDTVAMMDMVFEKRFNMLAEVIQDTRDDQIPLQRMEAAEDNIQVLQLAVRQNREDIQELREALRMAN